MKFLIRVDPVQRMNRWYSVSVQPTLFDQAAVVLAWGSRRTRYVRVRVIPAPSLDEAHQLAEKIVRRKLKKGYREREKG